MSFSVLPQYNCYNESNNIATLSPGTFLRYPLLSCPAKIVEKSVKDLPNMNGFSD